MNKSNIIEIPEFERPLFYRSNNEDSDFCFEWSPPLGILSLEPSALAIPGLAFTLFNPIALATLKEVKIGDIINITIEQSEITKRIYKEWNPPQEFEISFDYQGFCEVKFTQNDKMGNPIIIGSLKE